MRRGWPTIQPSAAGVLLGPAFRSLCGLAVGLVLSPILTIFGALFSEGVTVPPAGFGFAQTALLAGLALFLVNPMGGYAGSRLGEPPGA